MLSVFSALILPVGRQEGHLAYKKVGCWFVGGDNLTGALHYIAPVFTTTSIILAPVKSRMVVFCFRLSWVVLENGVLLLYHVVVLCLLSRAQASSDTSLCHGFSLYMSLHIIQASWLSVFHILSCSPFCLTKLYVEESFPLKHDPANIFCQTYL